MVGKRHVHPASKPQLARLKDRRNSVQARLLPDFEKAYIETMSRLALAVMATGLLALPAPAMSGTHGWDQASSIGRDALVVAALGSPIFSGDWKGEGQAAITMGAAFAVTEGLKYAVPETRPDGSGQHSFPSGHTSVSFAAAASLEKRYGWKIGVPSHVIAALVGVARIKADKHFVRDVVAGAVLGEASGWVFTTRRDSRVRWLPWADVRGGGAQFVVVF